MGGRGGRRRDRLRRRAAGRPLSGLASDLELATRAARAAAELLRERFGGPARGVERKTSRTDMVSDADRDAETVIADLLAAERPKDGLVAEEGGRSSPESGRTWVVDPLDGTTNYLYGFPAWAVSIALEDEGGSLVAVVLDGSREELFSAVRGEGGTVTGADGAPQPLGVSGCERLETALVATGFSYDADRRAQQAETLRGVLPRVRDIRRAGAAALDLCAVACGRLDGYYERGLQPWDWAAGRLLVSEAGGELRELDGDPPGLVAASPEIADALADLVT